jgi:hypothetical protein
MAVARVIRPITRRLSSIRCYGVKRNTRPPKLTA